MVNKANRVTQLDLSALKATSSSTQNNHRPAQSDDKKQRADHFHESDSDISPSQGHLKVLTGYSQALGLVDVHESPLPSAREISVRNESPWDTFNQEYECQLAGSVTVVTRRSSPTCAYSLRRLPRVNARDLLSNVRAVQHENVVSALEIFFIAEITYVLEEFSPLTLEHVVTCKAFPTQSQLTAIMVQARL